MRFVIFPVKPRLYSSHIFNLLIRYNFIPIFVDISFKYLLLICNIISSVYADVLLFHELRHLDYYCISILHLPPLCPFN